MESGDLVLILTAFNLGFPFTFLGSSVNGGPLQL